MMGQSSSTEVRFTCNYPDCQVDFSREADMVRHEKEVHSGEVYKCLQPGCTYPGTKRASRFKKHMAKRHPELYNVPLNVPDEFSLPGHSTTTQPEAQQSSQILDSTQYNHSRLSPSGTRSDYLESQPASPYQETSLQNDTPSTWMTNAQDAQVTMEPNQGWGNVASTATSFQSPSQLHPPMVLPSCVHPRSAANAPIHLNSSDPVNVTYSANYNRRMTIEETWSGDEYELSSSK